MLAASCSTALRGASCFMGAEVRSVGWRAPSRHAGASASRYHRSPRAPLPAEARRQYVAAPRGLPNGFAVQTQVQKHGTLAVTAQPVAFSSGLDDGILGWATGGCRVGCGQSAGRRLATLSRPGEARRQWPPRQDRRLSRICPPSPTARPVARVRGRQGPPLARPA